MADLNVTELDFDQIKGSLKEFLKNQSQFKDYDFEGSSMAVLLDLLAYNTHYNAYYMNMIANEMFLDTAQLRESVVSRAKMLGYTPRSASASRILVKIQVKVPTSVVDLPVFVTIPKYTKYKTVIDGSTYYFSNISAESATFSHTDGSNHIYTTPNIYLYEGDPIEQRFVWDKNDPSQRLLITNSNADTSTLNVRVQRSLTNTATSTFTKTVSITDLNSESQVYFLQEVEKELYEVYFGDGNMGKALDHGNIIFIDYLATNGAEANDAKEFKYTVPIEGYEQSIVISDGNTKSTGGAEREGIESIRYLAPLNFNSQNRVVTATDYRTAILQNYSDVQAVSSWGGEINDPPVYGKVFIALKPKSGSTFNDVTKDQIKDSILKSRNVVSITPEIIDPYYIFLEPYINVYFNREIGAYSSSDVQESVKSAVVKYSTDKLEQFDTYFRYSNFLKTVDASNPAIENSQVSLKMSSILAMTPNVSKSYVGTFSNALEYPHEGHFGSIITNTFTYFGDNQCYLSDDGYGVINVYKTLLGERRLIDTNLGTVNYETGKVLINSFAPEGADEKTLKITAIPRNQDIFAVRNQILQIIESGITVVATDSQTRYTQAVTSIFNGG